MNIYVGNLSRKATEEAVRSVFAVYGEVTEVKLVRDKYTNEMRGFGFVEMPSKSDALKAIENASGYELDGRRLVVSEARPRKEPSSSFNRTRYW